MLIKKLGVYISGLACLGLVCPVGVWAEPPSSQTAPAYIQTQPPAVVDLSLQDGDAVTGRLLNQNGRPLPNVTVAMLQQGSLQLQTVTDDNGWFRLCGVTPGQYQIAAADATATCRVWTDAARPPSAQDAVLLVTSNTLRGNWYDGIDRATIALGLSTAALVTSIVLPLALDDDGETLDRDVASP